MSQIEGKGRDLALVFLDDLRSFIICSLRWWLFDLNGNQILLDALLGVTLHHILVRRLLWVPIQ